MLDVSTVAWFGADRARTSPFPDSSLKSTRGHAQVAEDVPVLSV